MSHIKCKVEKKLWAEVVSIACYLIHRSPRVTLDVKVADEVWTGNEVKNLSKLDAKSR